MDYLNELPDISNIDHSALKTLVQLSIHAGAWIKTADHANRDTLLSALAQCELQGLEDQRKTALRFCLENLPPSNIAEEGNPTTIEGQLMPTLQDDETIIPNLTVLKQGLDDHYAAMQDIDATYGDGAKYDKDRLISETRFYLNHAAESVIEAGKRLVRLKEHELHGEFMKAVEQIGIEYTAAKRLMKVAAKFGNLPNGATLPHLDLGRVKMFELAMLDNEELEELDKGKTVRGLKVDELECMSVRELRATLRDSKLNAALERDKLKDKLEAKDRENVALQKIIDAKNQMLDKRSVLCQTAEGQETLLNELKQRLNYQVLTTVGNTNALWFQFSDLKEAMGEKRYEEFKLICAISLGQIAIIIRTLGEEWEVTPDMDAPSVFDAAITNPDTALFNAYMKDRKASPGAPRLAGTNDAEEEE